MLTFGDVKTDPGIGRITRFCPDSNDFAGLVWEAIRRLMRRGDWANTVIPMFFCVRNGCVVYPDYVTGIRAMSWCGVDMPIKNMWGGFLPKDRNAPWRNTVSWSCCNTGGMVTMGRTSVFQDIQGEGRLVRVYTRCNQDYGKTITIFGTDNNGQPLQQQDISTGVWSMGQTLVLAAGIVSTNTYVRSIDYIIKDRTQCPIDLYAYNAATNLLEDLAHYMPQETNPSYQKSRLAMPFMAYPNAGCSSSCSRSVAALAKVKQFPPQFDSDPIFLDCLDAIKLEMQAIGFGDAGDAANKREYEGEAIAELNRQLEDESPDDQFVADNQIFAGRTFTNQCF